jgi:hypothetical protein
MSADSIPDDVRDFIVKYIESIAQLEALLLLRREPEVSWDETSLGQRLYISSPAAADILARLAAEGFVVLDGGKYRYQCHSIEAQDVVERLAGIYARQLIPVTHLIHDKPSRIRQFADAFRLRKKDP